MWAFSVLHTFSVGDSHQLLTSVLVQSNKMIFWILWGKKLSPFDLLHFFNIVIINKYLLRSNMMHIKYYMDRNKNISSIAEGDLGPLRLKITICDMR